MSLTQFTHQSKNQLINAIKGVMLVLSGQATMENQVRFFGKYMPESPKTGRPEITFEFNSDSFFDVVFKKDERAAWNTASIYINEEMLADFDEELFSEVLQLDLKNVMQHEDTPHDKIYRYGWKPNGKISLDFKVSVNDASIDTDYPKHFTQIVISY